MESEIQCFDFSEALKQLRAGLRVGRREWVNAKWVYLVQGSGFKPNREPLTKFFPKGTSLSYNSHIDMCGNNDLLGTWTPSTIDMLALDWYVIPTDPSVAQTYVEAPAPEVPAEAPAVEVPVQEASVEAAPEAPAA